MQKSKSSAVKRSKFRKFLDTFCRPREYFSAIRLILPTLDRERGTYGLKESVLAACLVDALGMSRDSEDAQRLFNWRRGGPKSGANAGNFAMVANEVLQRRQGMTSGGLTINELNDLLDRLASSENRSEKASVLSTLIKNTNAQEMKWIVMIILKDLKLGISEKSIFHEFHPDAEDLFNVTCDLKLVCEKLRDRSQRHKRQDIEVGKPVRPQLAMRVNNAATAWKKFHGKEVVAECKFDGDRIQIHKNGTDAHFFSRNFLDHSEYEHGMLDIIIQNILVDRCILDGEMLVWDKSLNRFAEFGSNQEIGTSRFSPYVAPYCHCHYVAFDILYYGDTSVIHQSLKERHELLRKVVKPIKGRLELLVPDGSLNNLRHPGEPCWSISVHGLEDVERFFKETIENRDEGIVLKDLSSKWEPSDRSGKWLKLKPDYVRASSDLDVLIIGGYYGSGRRGGEVAQFLVGLAECPAPNTYPRRFISFCRVGTGLSEDELDAVITKLKPYLRKYEYPRKGTPSFYQVTDHVRERPDVWVESPEKSIILAITSDIRTISSEVFAAPYSLRFPRIDRVKWDKPWHECLDVQSFMDLVQSSNGTTQRDTGGYQDQTSGDQKHKRLPKKGKKEQSSSLVPCHFTRTDVSGVKEESMIFSSMMFYFVNVPPDLSLDALHKMVVENGGNFSMNLNNFVSHCIAAEGKGIKFQVATRNNDVIHYSWVLDCCSQRKLLPLQPKYFIFLSDVSKRRMQEEVDEFSDSYYWDLDPKDIKQLLSSVKGMDDSPSIEFHKRKYCPKEKWSRFHGCSTHFVSMESKLQPEWEILLTLMKRRLELEVHWGGGRVSKGLRDVTHLVVLEVPGLTTDLLALTTGLSKAEKQLLKKNGVIVVSSKWLEDSIESEGWLAEDPYKLHLPVADELTNEEGGHENPLEEYLVLGENLNTSPFPGWYEGTERNGATAGGKEIAGPQSEAAGRRKRGRQPSAITKTGRVVTTQARRTRPRLGKKPPKLSGNESDEIKCDAMDKGAPRSNNELGDGGMPSKAISEISKTESKEEPESSKKGGGAEEDIATTREKRDNEDHKRIEQDGNHKDRADEKIIPRLEIMNDPVQRMLLHMIPALGAKNAKPTNWATQDGKVEAGPTEEMAVPKKKKVSYKDIADELLKDII
ncbi:hypothetical protein SAY86_010318 [Trapa natans]|uniref:DNA ligase n=1 Tax=Trapa natans TaxID=22666 RepID=A0AAN7QTZ3_TRANT|nr:hypothetical protein SAY86_010318 [Trapa natans]